MKRKKNSKLEKKREKQEIVLLEDLTPRKDVKGGAAKIPFGQPLHLPDATGRGGKKR